MLDRIEDRENDARLGDSIYLKVNHMWFATGSSLGAKMICFIYQ